MSSGQHYTLQLEKLRELLKYLDFFNAEMLQIMNNYQKKLLTLENEGVPEEIIAKFQKDFFAESKDLIKKNEAIINDRAIPFVLNNIKVLERFNGFKKVSTRIAAGVVAGVATVAAPFARLSSTAQVENGNSAANGVAVHAESSYQPQSMEQFVEQQGFSMKKLGESAETIMNIVEPIAEGIKRKREAEEISEQNNALRELEQGEYRDG